MAFKKIRNDGYIADTKEDLKLIREKDMGAECYVIKEAAEYKLMSNGEWVKQTVATSGNGVEIDTSEFVTKIELEEAVNGIQIPSTDGLASEEFVEEKIAEIAIPSVEGLASETYVDEAIIAVNPIKDIYGDAHAFGLMVDSDDNKTLIEAMLEKGKAGMYNFHVEKGSPGQPDEVVEKNSSCRGIACVDTYRSDTNWYGWIIMFDQDGDIYTQYIRNAEPKGWKRMMTV